MNILIIQTAFTGDVILATPLIEKLHRFYPNANIDFLLRKGNEELLTAHPFLREVIIWDKKSDKQKNLLSTINKVRSKKYDVVVNAHRFMSSGLVTVLSGAKQTVGFNKNLLSFFFTKRIKHTIGDGTHEVQRNLNLITHLTDDSFERPKLYPSTNNYSTVKDYKSKPYVCIAPTSVWFTKQFPKEKWVGLIQMFVTLKSPPAGGDFESRYIIYLIGGPDDYNTCEEIKNASIITSKSPEGDLELEYKIKAVDKSDGHTFYEKLKPQTITNLKSPPDGGDLGVINLAGKLSYLQSAALIKDAVMNFVNDSAPLHMASAMNAPVTAVFCSTVPEFGFGPLSDHSKVVETSVSLDCRPCGLHGYQVCPKGHFKCALTIEVEDLKIKRLED